MNWTAETAPPPYFGVSVEWPQAVAHGFDKNAVSFCGVKLRLMRFKVETELPTCQACVDEAMRREKERRKAT